MIEFHWVSRAPVGELGVTGPWDTVISSAFHRTAHY